MLLKITDEFVINFMKQMGYPHTLKRQLFIAMTAPHNWP
jgi:hypothetical protein